MCGITNAQIKAMLKTSTWTRSEAPIPVTRSFLGILLSANARDSIHVPLSPAAMRQPTVKGNQILPLPFC